MKKLDKDIGSDVKKYLDFKFKISELTKQIDELKEENKDIEENLIIKIESFNLIRADCEIGSVTLKKELTPTVNNWDELYKFIVKNKSFELIQKRIGVTAWRERIESGIVVPGVESFIKKSLSIGRKR